MRSVIRLREGTRCLPNFSRARVSGLALLVASAGVAASFVTPDVQAHDGQQGPSSAAGASMPASVAEFMVPNLQPGAYRIIIRPVTPDPEPRLADQPPRDMPRSDRSAVAPSVSLRVPEITLRVPAISLRVDEFSDDSVRVSPTFSVRVPDAPRERATPEFEEPQPVFEARFDDREDNFSSRSLRRVANERSTRDDSRLRLNSDRKDSDTADRADQAATPSFDDDDLPLVRMKAPLASVRIEDDAPATVSPSFDDEAFEADERLPTVRMRAPLASVRIEQDDRDAEQNDVAEAPRPTFEAAEADTLPRVRIKAPLASVRVEDDAAPRTARPEFSVRPEFAPDDEAPRNTRRPAFDDEDGFGGDAAVIDPAQRPLPREDSRETAVAPRFDAPVFEDDALEPETRRAETTDFDADRADDNVERDLAETDTPAIEAPEFGAPAFAEERTPAARDNQDRQVVDRAGDPSFDAAEDAPRNETQITRLPRTPEAVDRADDFKSDPVGVAAAIARNRARYGASVRSDDDFFKLRGRYDWYKPVREDVRSRRASRGAQNPREREPTFDTDDTRDFGSVIELKDADDPDAALRRSETRPSFGPPEPDDLIREARLRDDLPRNDKQSLPASDPNPGSPAPVFGPPRREGDTEDAAREITDRSFAARFDDDVSEDTNDRGAETFGGVRGPDLSSLEAAWRTQTEPKEVTVASPQFDRLAPVMAGYRFKTSWTGRARGRGWIAISKVGARVGDYLSLTSAGAQAEVTVRAPSEPGTYELRFLARDRRVILARQRIDVNAAKVRLVALEFVDPSDELNVWWSGPGDREDSLTLAPAGAEDANVLARQSIGKGNPLTMKAPSEPGTYEMRYVNGSDNRVMYRRKLVVAAKTPKLLGP
ncbi:MAG: hypothetical protein AAFZ01_08890 [Pseudomonadota bacterium]